jgi:hypothetical protein
MNNFYESDEAFHDVIMDHDTPVIVNQLCKFDRLRYTFVLCHSH